MHQATPLPLTGFSPPDDMIKDTAFLAANGVRILMAVAVYDCFKRLREGGAVEGLVSREASPELLRQVNRSDEFIQPQRQYLRG